MKIEINDNNGKWHQSFTIKMVLLAFMGLFLLIPLEMIKEMIQERQQTSELIKNEISSQWAGPQIVAGPVLNIPVLIYPSAKDVDPYRSVFHVMPEALDVKSIVSTEKRHRSIYEAVVYTSDFNISGEFIIPEIKTGENSEVLWNEAYYSVGISDNRGIKGAVSLKTDTTTLEAVPGLREAEMFSSGITFPVRSGDKIENVKFNLTLKLSGSESIYFIPIGKTTTMNMKSGWNAPGFTGKFLPTEKEINQSGFTAEWLITNLNRNFPQSWFGNAYHIETDSFGTNFVLEVDHYQKSIRSAKYGILFIALTFLALLFVEIYTGSRIHVFNYLQLALGLVLFFSLLNALSEQIGFTPAYLAASVSTIVLITSFFKALIRNNRMAYLFGGLLVFLYSFIFILLTLNDYAYLAGNIGLFALLAITMRFSLKLELHKAE